MEVDPDAEYVNMVIPWDGTLRPRMMPWEQYMGILQVHRAQGPEIMALKLQNMYIWLGFSPKAAKLLIREQGLDNPNRLRVLTNKNVDDICNVVRKPGSKNADGTPDRGQQVSVIAQENLKLAFLFHHRWICTLEKNGTFLSGPEQTWRWVQRPQHVINKPDMAGMMESIKEHLRTHHGVVKAFLAYVIRKTIIVQTNGDYPTYATSDDEMITRILYLPSHKNKLQLESSVNKVQDHTPEYTIDNKMVYDILDQICKDTDLYPYMK